MPRCRRCLATLAALLLYTMVRLYTMSHIQRAEHLPLQPPLAARSPPPRPAVSEVAAMPLTALAIVESWARRYDTTHAHPGSSCARRGFTFTSWCDFGQGTGNCMNRVMTAALVAVVFDTRLVLLDTKRAFRASLVDYEKENVRTVPWLHTPRCTELRDNLKACGTRTVHTLHFNTVHPDVCHPFGNMSDADLIRVTTFAQWDFAQLMLYRGLPAAAHARMRALTAPGTNAYGLVLRAMWPDGLTKAAGALHRTMPPMTAGLHVRCHYGGCFEKPERLFDDSLDTFGLERPSQNLYPSSFLLETVDCLVRTLPKPAPPGCSIYVATDELDALAQLTIELHTRLANSTAAHCRVVTARDLRASLGQELEEELLLSEHGSHGDGRYGITHGDRDVWMMPVDLDALATASFVVGTPSSTFTAVVGASAGRLYYGRWFGRDGLLEKSELCTPMHHYFPLDDKDAPSRRSSDSPSSFAYKAGGPLEILKRKLAKCECIGNECKQE